MEWSFKNFYDTGTELQHFFRILERSEAKPYKLIGKCCGNTTFFHAPERRGVCMDLSGAEWGSIYILTLAELQDFGVVWSEAFRPKSCYKS